MKTLCQTTLCLAAVLAALPFQAAYAEQNPKRTAYDARIQYTNYNPDNVVNIRTRLGEVTMVQLAEGETVNDETDSGLGMGDGGAWKMDVRGRHLFFKPKTDQDSDTNMIIASNKGRIYAFRLHTAKQGQATTYVLRFRYPAEEAAARRAQQLKEERVAAMLNRYGVDADTVAQHNHNYWGRGDKTLSPSEIFDNGRFTFLRYNNSKALPAVFRVNDDGSEAAINAHVENDTLIIHETAKHFVLRQGKAVLGIENRGYDPEGKFNKLGTTEAGTVRLQKGVLQ